MLFPCLCKYKYLDCCLVLMHDGFKFCLNMTHPILGGRYVFRTKFHCKNVHMGFSRIYCSVWICHTVVEQFFLVFLWSEFQLMNGFHHCVCCYLHNALRSSAGSSVYLIAADTTSYLTFRLISPFWFVFPTWLFYLSFLRMYLT